MPTKFHQIWQPSVQWDKNKLKMAWCHGRWKKEIFQKGRGKSSFFRRLPKIQIGWVWENIIWIWWYSAQWGDKNCNKIWKGKFNIKTSYNEITYLMEKRTLKNTGSNHTSMPAAKEGTNLKEANISSLDWDSEIIGKGVAVAHWMTEKFSGVLYYQNSLTENPCWRGPMGSAPPVELIGATVCCLGNYLGCWGTGRKYL